MYYGVGEAVEKSLLQAQEGMASIQKKLVAAKVRLETVCIVWSSLTAVTRPRRHCMQIIDPYEESPVFISGTLIRGRYWNILLFTLRLFSTTRMGGPVDA